MKKFAAVLVTGVLLGLVEWVLLLLCFQAEQMTKYSVPLFQLHKALKGAYELSSVRAVLYFPFWVLAMWLLSRCFLKANAIWWMSVMNLILYVLTSYLLTLFFPFANELFERSFFGYLVGGTLLSPFLISIFPFGRKLVRDFSFQ